MLYEFTELQLDVWEVHNLVFMNEPDWWKNDQGQHDFLLKLCGKPLHKVVEEVKQKSGQTGEKIDPIEVFKSVQDIFAQTENGDLESDPWFKSNLDLSKDFNLNLMPPIWIRNLSENLGNNQESERDKCPNGTYYIEDGNTRALIYALKINGRANKYKLVPAIHATSWEIASGVLGHLPQKADVLENKGVLPHKKQFKQSIHFPIGIRADFYERPYTRTYPM